MAIDSTKIMHAVIEGSRVRESKGIIPLFGVYLSLLSLRHYHRIAHALEEKLGPARRAEAGALLAKASQQAGYAAFQAIRNSWEWGRIVAPLIDRKEDEILGFTALAGAFGWGQVNIEALVPEQRLVLRVDHAYEADGYLECYGQADSAKCYMLRGVAGAFMDLVYGEGYPGGCFSFVAQETLCRAKGDHCCEFIAQKPST